MTIYSKVKIFSLSFGISLLSVVATLSSTALIAAEESDRLNVVLILADDLGFTDISPFGGEINTPNIARLATEGLSFTNYHTAGSCAPARAMLLTGVDSHRNGVPNIPEALPPELLAYDHYQGVLNDRVVTLACILKNDGYQKMALMIHYREFLILHSVI